MKRIDVFAPKIVPPSTYDFVGMSQDEVVIIMRALSERGSTLAKELLYQIKKATNLTENSPI